MDGVSGSDVRSDGGSIKWWIDRLPAKNLTTCHPFDAGALVAAYPNVGRRYPLQVRIKWDFIDDQRSDVSFVINDCWRVSTTAVNAAQTSTC